MEIFINCEVCRNDSKGPFKINIYPNNNGIYEIECPNGHKFRADILSLHFEVLFKNGLAALKENFLIEAFASFASAFERFLEYFIRIVLLTHKIDLSELEETWKAVSSQSERQIGAFIFVYLKEFGKKPQLLKKGNTEIRNKVIHKGYFPSKDECIDYGDDVLEIIRSIIKLLKENEQYFVEMLKSVNDTGDFKSNDINIHYLPYSIFAINREIDDSDKRTVKDFLT